MATIERYLLPATAGGKMRTERERVRYRVRYRTPDRRQTDKRGFTSKRAAEDFAATIEASKLRGEYIDPAKTRVRLDELGTAWLGRQSHLKPSSKRSVDIAWRVHVQPRWGAVSVVDVAFTDVQAWVSTMSATKGATTVIRAYGVLAAILDDAVRDRRMLTNPARGIDLPRKVHSEHTYLTHQQVHDLAAAAGDKGALILLLAYCGLRWGEATGLRVRDFNLLRQRISVAQNAVEVGSKVHVGTPKNHKRRTVPVPAFLSNHLEAQCEGKLPDDLLFPGPSGGFLRRSRSESGWFHAAVRASGVPTITAHGLRHTSASLSISAGANVKAVQRALGHASAAMTLDIYSDLFDDDLEAVATALDHAAAQHVVGRTWAGGVPG